MSLPRITSLVALALCVGLSACDSAEDDFAVEPGAYTEFGSRYLLDGEVVSEGLAWVYFARSLRFGADGRFTVEVYSDFQPEVGVARGRYETVNGGLDLYVEATTTSVYEAGEVVRYERAEVVDASYRTAFDIDGNGVEFVGPGLILSSASDDTSGRSDERESYFRGPVAPL